MDTIDTFSPEIFWQKDTFRFIKPDEFENLGIDSSDIPLGTFPAQRHPSYLPSRFGGNAYGFGLFEFYDRLRPKDISLLQNIDFENTEDVKERFKELNRIYKKVGLLIRFSQFGKPYYLIPIHLISGSITRLGAKIEEISRIILLHLQRHNKESLQIGLVTHQDDLLFNELSFRLKEHLFIVLDSLEKLQSNNMMLDIVILTKDIYEIILMERFGLLSQEKLSKIRFYRYGIFFLWKIHNLLKSDGEIFMIANHYTPKTKQATKVIFKNLREEKNFAIFSHIFRTKKKYTTKDHAVMVNIFDFQNYLSGLYVEQEVLEKLMGGKDFESMTLEEINSLPYFNFQLNELPSLADQEKTWARLFSAFFEKIFLKPFLPVSVKEEWKKKFSSADYSPNYMMVYLGRKKPIKTTLSGIKQEIAASSLSGCPIELLADYRDSFEYVLRTLRVLEKIKRGDYKDLPQSYIDRLKQPLENKSRRFSALNDIIKLMAKMRKLENVKEYLNPDGIEGSKTKVFANLEALGFFGFTHNEIKEMAYIVLGHTPLGRIISGKINEKKLKEFSEIARTYDSQQAINLLRYCRLMTMAETEAARKREVTQEELAELFDLHELTAGIVINKDLDWERLLDEKIASMGGIHNKIIRKTLQMINHFEFLNNWPEILEKGQMEKEALADYDETKLHRIENVIRLIKTIGHFEQKYLKSDPLQLPAFYRKFLNIEFHGTGHIFERMRSDLVFTLLWITVNLARGEIINFNPLLADVETSEIENRVIKIEREAGSINVDFITFPLLRQFSEQLYQDKTSFILGTGFQLKVGPETQGLEIAYMDIDRIIERLGAIINKISDRRFSEITPEDLEKLEVLFSNMDSFYQSHLRILSQAGSAPQLPKRDTQWFQKAHNLGMQLRSILLNGIFLPEDLYTNLGLLYRHTPSILNFILPQFSALDNLDLSWHLYLNLPVTHYIIKASEKLQALVKHEKESFQDTQMLHKLAQMEFGLMATGIVGVNETQIEDLEKIVESLRKNAILFDALIKSLVLQDIGRVPFLRKKYRNKFNPADLGQAGAFFLENEQIEEQYQLDEHGKAYLIFLVRHHSLFHHVIRGELCFSAIQNVTDNSDKELFDALFILSFIMLSSIREDLMLEDLAGQLLQIRILSHKIIDGETTPVTYMNEIYIERGNIFYILENCLSEGVPEGITPSECLQSNKLEGLPKSRLIQAGKMIFALERIFRLRGIRYVQFFELANLILGVPLKYIHKKRRFSSVGYSTFEKEIYEAFRVYKTLQNIPEGIRHFILNQLIGDKVRIYGYEKVSGYLSYENQIKLLFLVLTGSQKFRPKGAPICLDFLSISEMIEKRHDAVNAHLNSLSVEELWNDKSKLLDLFKAKTGIVLRKAKFPNVLSLKFQDPINIAQKIGYMDTINNVDQLNAYFHHSLKSLKDMSFYTDDYQAQLETAYQKRLTEITDMLLKQTTRQMNLVKDFKELHNLVKDLLEQSGGLGFSEDQKHRLNDLYELRMDSLKRKKLSDIEKLLENINDIDELNEYWDSVKWYLKSNRIFFGKEFENHIALKFDEKRNSLSHSGKNLKPK